MKTVINYNCDGDHCREANGEVRVLPTGGGSNLLLCLACFTHELEFRKERNRELETGNRFDLPLWHDLKVYKS